MTGRIAALLSLYMATASGFTLPQASRSVPASLWSSETEEAVSVSVDPKEAVKLFGRLADKYILLDSSGECNHYLFHMWSFLFLYLLYYIYFLTITLFNVYRRHVLLLCLQGELLN